MTKEYIDLMIEAGTINCALALETASPRLQTVIKKNLDIKRLRENVEYIVEKYPHFILELFTMHGFPTESKEEARMTLDFIKSIKWIHFPYVNLLRIYPNTQMETFALQNGISQQEIFRSENLPYHELPGTLPFEKSFSFEYQTEFLHHYFLSRERLLSVLPHQVKILTEEEIIKKYDSYLPGSIKGIADILQLAGISPDALDDGVCLPEEQVFIPNLNEKIRKLFLHRDREKDSSPGRLRILLLDVSQLFETDNTNIIYNVGAVPLGLMYIATYLDRQLGDNVECKIAKSGIDFNDFPGLESLLKEFSPDVIGMRTLTCYKDFFSQTVAKIRQWNFNGPIVVGGPYATSEYLNILPDNNIDILVLGEGEITFTRLIKKIIENDKKLPGPGILKTIAGIAFGPGAEDRQLGEGPVNHMESILSACCDNLENE